MNKNLGLIAVNLVEWYSFFVSGWWFWGVHHVVICFVSVHVFGYIISILCYYEKDSAKQWFRGKGLVTADIIRGLLAADLLVCSRQPNCLLSKLSSLCELPRSGCCSRQTAKWFRPTNTSMLPGGARSLSTPQRQEAIPYPM